MKKYMYVIYFKFGINNNISGAGNYIAEMDYKLDSNKRILELLEGIKKEVGYPNVIIINIMKLK